MDDDKIRDEDGNDHNIRPIHNYNPLDPRPMESIFGNPKQEYPNIIQSQQDIPNFLGEYHHVINPHSFIKNDGFEIPRDITLFSRSPVNTETGQLEQMLKVDKIAQRQLLAGQRRTVLLQLPYDRLIGVVIGSEELGDILYDRFAPALDVFRQRMAQYWQDGRLTPQTDDRYEKAVREMNEYFLADPRLYQAKHQMLELVIAYPEKDGMDEVMKMHFHMMGAITLGAFERAAILRDQIRDTLLDMGLTPQAKYLP